MTANNINDQDYEDQPVDGDDVVYDDTYDEAETYTEDDSEEWSEGDEEVAQEEQPQQQKKKSSTLTVIIILVVAIVGVLGFMVLTGGSNAPAPEEAAQPQAVIDADPESATADAQQAAPTDAAANGQNVFDNPGTVESQLAPTQDAVPAPAADPNAPAVAQDAPPVPSLDDPSAAQPTDVVGAIAPSVKPVSDFPTVDSIKKPGADQGGEPVAAAPTNPVETAPVEPTDPSMLPVPSDATGGSMTAPAPEMTDLSVPSASPAPQVNNTGAADAKLAVVTGQLTDAQKKIAELEKSLAAQTSALAAEKEKAAVADSMADNSEEVDSLKAKIVELEAKLSAKAAAPVAAAVPERQIAEQDQYDEVEPVRAAEPKKPAPAVVKQKAPQRPQWTLKSASSSKAILADKSTGDLKTVRVGDTVSGLGRIVSISDNGTSWVVKGTVGSVAE